MQQQLKYYIFAYNIVNFLIMDTKNKIIIFVLTFSLSIIIGCNKIEKSELCTIIETSNSQCPIDYEIMRMDSIIYDAETKSICYYAQITSNEINFEQLKEHTEIGKAAIQSQFSDIDDSEKHFFDLIVENGSNIKYVYANQQHDDDFIVTITTDEIIEMINYAATDTTEAQIFFK